MSVLVVCDGCLKTISGVLPGYPATTSLSAVVGRIAEDFAAKRPVVGDQFDLCADCAGVALAALSAAHKSAA